MAIPTPIQSGQVASSSSAPASFTASLTQASAAGNLLLATVAAATSGAATYTMPAGWVLVKSASAAGIDVRMFQYPNNPGAIANIAITAISNVNGLVVGFVEVSGMQLVSPGDLAAGSANASGTAAGAAALTNVYGNEFWYGMTAWLTGGGAGAANNTGTWTTIGNATSTSGATNVKLVHGYSLPGPVFATQQFAQTITSAANGGVEGTFISTSTGAVGYAGGTGGYEVSGGTGYAVGQ